MPAHTHFLSGPHHISARCYTSLLSPLRLIHVFASIHTLYIYLTPLSNGFCTPLTLFLWHTIPLPFAVLPQRLPRAFARAHSCLPLYACGIRFCTAHACYLSARTRISRYSRAVSSYCLPFCALQNISYTGRARAPTAPHARDLCAHCRVYRAVCAYHITLLARTCASASHFNTLTHIATSTGCRMLSLPPLFSLPTRARFSRLLRTTTASLPPAASYKGTAHMPGSACTTLRAHQQRTTRSYSLPVRGQFSSLISLFTGYWFTAHRVVTVLSHLLPACVYAVPVSAILGSTPLELYRLPTLPHLRAPPSAHAHSGTRT